MQLTTIPYAQHLQKLPESGRHIIAQFDQSSIIVYQAYRPSIGNFAARNGYLGGDFRLQRMSWIKPNFLWMMYRSRCAQKPGQEVILAIKLQRIAFDEILGFAVHSKYIPELYADKKSWQRSLNTSDVRLQWDPDRQPNGDRLARKAIQLGLRGEVLAKYAREWIVNIEDISEFVRQQYEIVKSGNWDSLIVPEELVYPAIDPETVCKLQLSALK